ncbi:MAG: hypothetical protein A2234_05010 [Elusimicrobia bacterium RIFOXYA2_FULL_58_8]|nr:MAG: hypothetical protein A2234_05010 [Elusimicrobia bacterium RIFOXYA2_FULL_58_8]
MRWKTGDKCVLDETVFNRFIKSFGSDVCRAQEVYTVVDADPCQAVVIISDKEGKASIVLDSWILPLKDTDWKACKQLLDKSSSPTDLIKRLNAPKPVPESKEAPKTDHADKPDSLPDTKRMLMKMLDQLEIALSGSLTIGMAIIKVYLQRHW